MKACKLRKALTSLVTSVIFVSYLVMPGSALGQTANSGVITGVVKDQSGALELRDCAFAAVRDGP